MVTTLREVRKVVDIGEGPRAVASLLRGRASCGTVCETLQLAESCRFTVG